MSHATDLFRQTTLSTDEKVYTMVKLPAESIAGAVRLLGTFNSPFSAILVDRHEVTLVLPVDFWQSNVSEVTDAVAEGRFRLITFESVLAFDVVGFMALVATILTEARISILPFAAFSRDHLLVAEDRFEDAWRVLHAAQ